MGKEILVRPATIARMKVHEITKDSSLCYSFNKMNSAFDKLEEEIFGTPIIATLPLKLLKILLLRSQKKKVLACTMFILSGACLWDHTNRICGVVAMYSRERGPGRFG